MSLLALAAAIYIVWFVRNIVRAANEGIAEGELIAEKNRQNYWAGIYINLTRADWESLGVSREILRKLVGEQNYKKLIRKWYKTR